jgi:type II secretory pathway component PulF
MRAPCQADTFEAVAPPRRVPFGILYIAYQLASTLALLGLVGPHMRVFYGNLDVPLPGIKVHVLDMTELFLRSWPTWIVIALLALVQLWRRGQDRGAALSRDP